MPGHNRGACKAPVNVGQSFLKFEGGVSVQVKHPVGVGLTDPQMTGAATLTHQRMTFGQARGSRQSWTVGIGHAEGT